MFHFDKIGIISYIVGMTDNDIHDTPQTHTHTKDTPKSGDERQKLREQRRRMLADLRANMESALTSPSKGGDPAAELEKQMDVLNSIFMRLLADADDKWDMQSQYALALRAQNQFRKTFQVTESVKKQREASKNDKRTKSKSLK